MKDNFYSRVLLIALVVLLGLGSGWLLVRFKAQRGKPLSVAANRAGVGNGGVRPGQVYGQAGADFKDQAVGVLAKNDDPKTDGTHKLLREGGESQTVYLTSSVIDLDKFVGHKVQIWGKTFASTKVAWLMDVGRLKILE